MHLPDDHMRYAIIRFFAGRLAADRVCRLAARPYACPFLMSAPAQNRHAAAAAECPVLKGERTWR